MLKLEDLPNGTIIKYGEGLYCIQQGLDDRIIVDVNDGTWDFLRDINCKKFEILYNPTEKV